MEFETEGVCSLVADSTDACLPAELFTKSEKKSVQAKATECDAEDELCLVESKAFKELKGPKCVHYLLRTYFKRVGPAETKDWLDNDGIDGVLTQAHEKWPEFFHIPFQMIDFQDTGTELARFDIEGIRRDGFNTWGVVINTDKSHVNGGSGGIHWFAMFGDLRSATPTIEYFNSSGELPMPQIRALIKRLSAGLTGVKTVIASTFQQQRDGYSCGAYSLYYILSRLEGVSYKYFQQNSIGDDVMVEFRKYLFRPDTSG